MKKVFTLAIGTWYNIKYLKTGAKRGYHGPAKFMGEAHGLLAFILPENLHLLRGDEEEIEYSFFLAKDVMSEYQGPEILDYFELLEEVLSFRRRNQINSLLLKHKIGRIKELEGKLEMLDKK